MKADKIKEVILEIAKRQEYELTEAQLQDIQQENILINVSFLGEFSSGKSTIVNNLIGRDLLPTYVEPTSAVITEILPGDYDEYVVERFNEDNETILESIEFHQLASEAMKHETNKKIHITQKYFGILSRDVLIVDTPGVSSINNTHTDVTFGYLPYIDVAFIVIAASKGDTPESLIEFIRTLPKIFLNKIYFILNKIDLKPESSVDKIEERLKESLSTIIPDPKIIKISALEAGKKIIDGEPLKILETTMAPMISILNDEVPKLKREVEEKRRKEALVQLSDQVVTFLKVKLSGIKYSDEEIVDKIAQIKSEIAQNEKEITVFKGMIENVKMRIQNNIVAHVNDVSTIIATKVDKGESIQEEIDSLLQKLNSIIESGLSEIQDVSKIKLENSLSGMINYKIDSETKFLTQTAEIVRNIADFLLILTLIPGNSMAEKVVAGGHNAITSGVETAKKFLASDKGVLNAVGKFQRKFPRLLGFIGEIAKHTDPVGLAKSFIMQKFILEPKLRDTLTNIIQDRLNEVFTQINIEVDLILDTKFRIPMNGAVKALTDLRKKRDITHSNLDAYRVEIENDIRTLTELEKE